MVACTHRQRWEHWLPLFLNNEAGKVVCGSERDVFETDPDLPSCACSEDCTCKDKSVLWYSYEKET